MFNMASMAADECRADAAEIAYTKWLSDVGIVVGFYVAEGSQLESDLFDYYADKATPVEAAAEVRNPTIIKATQMIVTYADGSRGPFGSLRDKVVECTYGCFYTVYDTKGGPAFTFMEGVNRVTKIEFPGKPPCPQ